MEETFLSPVINILAGLLLEEVKALKGVLGDIKSIKDELDIIQPLLKDADNKSKKGGMSDTVRAWMKQIREEASHIEDVIDEYRHHVEQQKKLRNNGFTVNSLCNACHFIKDLKQRHDIASEIKSIKQSLGEIYRRAQGCGLRPLEEGSSSRSTDVEADNHRLQSLFMEKEELVGIESNMKELVGRLVEGQSERSVISLVGEGGVGKTTLVKQVYDYDVVQRHFESARAWITVSSPFNLKKILKKMKDEICKTEEKIPGEKTEEVEKLIDYLRRYLQTKRYMIIFDDVWQENFWDKIKHALPSNYQGSRIIITTRNSKIANSCKETPHDLIQNLKRWSDLGFAWELFCKKAFRHEQGKCPEELKQLSSQIVSKCQGLPLVIAAIASLLSTKEKVSFEWKKVLDDLNSKAEPNSEQIARIPEILSLSYYDLPHYLRSCFLYFGLFPKDYQIKDERLYRLWIADGFIKEKRGKTMEEVAEQYLNELVQRNLVICDPQQSVGEGTGFRVHDLMRDVILPRAEEVCFYQIWDERNSESRVTARRLTICGSTKTFLKNVKSSGVRSIFFFDVDDHLTESFIASLSKKFKFLEVLDFGNVSLDTLPKQLGNLFQLKYLSLKSTKIKMLPKSISMLQNLESLDIRDTLIHELPSEINKLTNLKYLLAYSYNNEAPGSFDFVRGVTIQEGFGELVDLQTLTLLEANDLSLIKELEKLRKLRWLGISKLTRETGRALCTSIGQMDHLERLFITSIDENELLDLELPISYSPQFLRDLVLICRLEKSPVWIPEFRNLRGLGLKFTRLVDEPSKCLKGLANLETLRLGWESYEGKELHFEQGGFQKLTRLTLNGLRKLEVLKIDKGALPLIEVLWIKNCSLLREFPSIQDLPNVKTAVINKKRLL